MQAGVAWATVYSALSTSDLSTNMTDDATSTTYEGTQMAVTSMAFAVANGAGAAANALCQVPGLTKITERPDDVVIDGSVV